MCTNTYLSEFNPLNFDKKVSLLCHKTHNSGSICHIIKYDQMCEACIIQECLKECLKYNSSTLENQFDLIYTH